MQIGIGFRTSLWVSGCARKCPGCFNPEAWSPDVGKKFNENTVQKILKTMAHDYCHGLSVLGGEPFSITSNHRDVLPGFLKTVKETYPNKDIWIWTGYSYEELITDPRCVEALKYVDVLVDGPFIEADKDLTCPWRGSTNQRILHLNEGKIV